MQSVTCGATSGRCHALPDRQTDSAAVAMEDTSIGDGPRRHEVRKVRRPNVPAAVCRAPGPGSRRSEVLRTGRARFVRVRTEVYTGERGPRPRETRRAAPCAGGLRDIVLRAYAAKTPGRIAAGLSGSPPGRIAGALPWTDRPVRSVEALLQSERAVAPLSQLSTPGSRPESSPRPTRRTAAHGHTGERL